MKTILIAVDSLADTCFETFLPADAFNKMLSGFRVMESQILYFSAGEGRIKELLIKKDPGYSA